MADLIDRQALIKALGEQMDRCPLTYLWGLDKAVTTANKLPAVDAVEVVRCKDCKDGGRCEVEYLLREVDKIENPYCAGGKRRGENG